MRPHLEVTFSHGVKPGLARMSLWRGFKPVSFQLKPRPFKTPTCSEVF